MKSNSKLISAELVNFKSFLGRHLIGPFTSLTAVIGPNGGGKSNLIDAVAFALALPLPRGKHAHVRDLVYTRGQQIDDDVARGMAENSEAAAAGEQVMSVKLNFENGISVKRTYTVSDQISEQSLIQNEMETPMTMAEYKQKVLDLKLEVSEFCIYQDRMLNYTKQNLNDIFERLSGSVDFKAEYDRLMEQKLAVETQLREVSELLKERKHEKVKVKGLGDYQKQIESCISEQKQVTELLAIVRILAKEKEVEKLTVDESEIANSVNQTYEHRQGKLREFRKLEQTVRRAENQLTENQQAIKQVRTQLVEAKDSQMEHDQKVRACQGLLQQKEKMLNDFNKEKQTAERKVSGIREVLSASEANLDKIRHQISNSPALQKQQELREDYLEIRSSLQTENASIERQTCKVESQMQSILHQQAGYLTEIKKIEGQLAAQTDLPKLQAQLEQINAKIRQNEKSMGQAQEQLAALKGKSVEQRQKVQVVERELLEAGYELSELESEKQIKSSDARTAKILKELRGRCRGFYGQLFELVKPINAKYDIAVKVALSKCLKFLVVNSADSAQMVNEFLREKQITRDVLILSNVPDRNFSRGLQAKLDNSEASLIYDVIDISKKDPLLERAIRYFCADKVVTKTFDMAARLQAQKGIKEIVTEDGTEFKQGMISGGHHANVFNLSLGINQLDSTISKFVDKVQRLEKEHMRLKQELEDGITSKETKSMRQVSAIELELEALRDKKGAVARQILAQTESCNELNNALLESKGHNDQLVCKLEELRAQKATLQEEVQAAEQQAFKNFCKRAKVKSVAEFEAQLFSRPQLDSNQSGEGAGELTPEQLNSRELPKTESGLLASKFDFESAISKCQADLKFNEQQLEFHSKNIEAIQTSFQEEKQKLERLRTESRDKGTDNHIQKLQEEYLSMDESLLVIQKQVEQLSGKRSTLRQELDNLASRDETLQKSKNSASMKIKELQTAIDESIESAMIDKTITFCEENEDPQSLEKPDILSRLVALLDDKGQIDNDQPKTVENLKSLESEYAKKVRELEAIEDKFNQCVAIIPETDENTIRLTHEITKLKDQLDATSAQFTEAKESLSRVRCQRKDKFLELFDLVSNQLPVNYRELTKAAGTANLLISDRIDKPFESPIIFDFCPPGKRHGVDLDMLSGGEKTMAALAFVFAMAQIVKPSLLMMDEVDAFLDSDNVAELSSFIKTKLNLFSKAVGQPTQILCVSHKEELAQQMDSLIGVCMLKQHQTSKAYTVDLSNLEQ